MSFLLDKNILIYHFGGRLLSDLPEASLLYSVITEIELRSFARLSAQDMANIRLALSQMQRIELTDAVREKAIIIRRDEGLKLPDAIVVASAMVQGVILLTNDARLHKIKKLQSQSLTLKP